jgi:hypothetical protein
LPVVHALPHTPQLLVVLSGVHALAQHPCPVGQHTPAHGVNPAQSRHSVPPALQKPLAQFVTCGVGHWPLALQTAAAVKRPLVHDWAGPQGVPAFLLVVSVQTGMPVAQAYAPFLQGFAGGQVWPWVHDSHEPL